MELSNLTPTQFEELCFDLLAELGYTKLSWRKGTDCSTSPADQGRDIEALFSQKEPDGHVYDQHWFVECKHYTKGIPPASLQSLFAWASAEAPDVVLIIASGFLSNSAKTWLKTYQEAHKISFKVRVWERKDLERLLACRTALLRKYQLKPDLTFLDMLHPLHIEFIRKPPINTFQFFHQLLDRLDPSDREKWFGPCFLCLINPRCKESKSEGQTIGELFLDTVSYHEFKKACFRAAQVVPDFFLVRSIVSEALNIVFRPGDLTAREEYLGNLQSALASFEAKLEDAEAEKTRALERCINSATKKITSIDSDLAAGRQSYPRFCESILAPLFLESFPKEQLRDV